MTATIETSAPTPLDVRSRRSLASRIRDMAPAEPIPFPTELGVVQVTPLMAASWLERNPVNRSLSLAYVDDIARDMHNKMWLYDGMPVRTSTVGTVLDGQHRLAAICDSGVSQAMLVVPDLPPETQDVMDTGRKRSVADSLQMRGEANATVLAAIARLGLLDERGTLGNGRAKATPSEIRAWLAAHPEVRGYATRAAAYRGRIKLPMSVSGFCMWKLAQVDVFEAGRFFDDIAQIRTTGDGDPVATLITRLHNAKESREKLTQPMQIGLVIRVWNCRRTGESIGRLPVMVRGGVVTIPTPK